MSAVLRQGVKALAAGVDQVAAVAGRRPPGLVVLLYHEVGGPRPGPVNLSVAAFEEQVAGLVVAGSLVSLDDGLARLASGQPFDRTLVAITFDDGTAGFIEHAVPVLVRHRAPATLYVATAWVEEQRSFWDDGTVLSWSALGEALSTGVVEVGSHAHRHLLFDREVPEVLADDLDRSIDLLGERLGVSARHFAYPKALAPSPAAEGLVRSRFASAALAGTRANRPGADPHRLARSPVQVSDGVRWFRRKAAGGLGAEDAARRAVNRVRHRRAER